MSVAIAVFVKTPGYSAVKTRLAESLGVDRASECHRRCAAAVAQVLATAAADAGLVPYWAVAEDAALTGACWLGFPVVAQGEGGLGARMARVHGALVDAHGAAILIGADAPQLDPGILTRAARWLQASPPHLGLGPARDGGFWLFGSNRTFEPTLWSSVRYSRADTARNFRAALDGRGDWLDLPVLTDLDRAVDLAPVAAELLALAHPSPLQRELAQWLADAARTCLETPA